MKYASFEVNGRRSWGVVKGATLTDMGGQGARWTDLKSFLADGAPAQGLVPGDSYAVADVTLLPVIPKPDLIAMAAVNYREGDMPTGKELPYPVLFLRLPSSQVGHLAPLIKPAQSEKLDFEGELAVIIGKGGRHIPKENAYDHVAGYSVYNDGSVRDWQKHSHQFTPGKNFVGTGAFGPWMVTPDEIPPLEQGIALTTRVNGEVKQSTLTSRMIFDVPYLINYVSTFAPLAPGDVIVTGTCGGFGSTRQPPEFLSVGDVVEVEIEGIGVLRNTVQHEDIAERAA